MLLSYVCLATCGLTMAWFVDVSANTYAILLEPYHCILEANVHSEKIVFINIFIDLWLRLHPNNALPSLKGPCYGMLIIYIHMCHIPMKSDLYINVHIAQKKSTTRPLSLT